VSDNTSQEREKKNNSQFNDVSGSENSYSENCKQPLFRPLFRRFFQWATTTIPGIIASLIGILLVASTIFANFTGMVADAESWCKVSCIFPWCDECEPPPIKPPVPIKLARKLFGDNSTDLQVKIQPTPPLNVGQEIYLHFTNNSNSNGYFLAFSIDSEGKLFSFISKISERLELRYIPRYLKIDKGQTIIIPQPNVLEDPLAGMRVDKTIGQAILVVILVDELTLELIDVLLPKSGVSPSEVLTNLHEKLIKPLPVDSGTRRLQWSSLVIEYETVSSQTRED